MENTNKTNPTTSACAEFNSEQQEITLDEHRQATIPGNVVACNLSAASSSTTQDKILPSTSTATDSSNVKQQPDPTSSSSTTEGAEPGAVGSSVLDCPICLQACVHPARLPCGHIFCFLCIKGVAFNKNQRCAMCRREIPPEFLDRPQLVNGIEDIYVTKCTEDGYQWFYEGRNGWWQYDVRTSQDIEEAYKTGEKLCTILVAGFVYMVDLEAMVQQRQNEPSRCRRVKRDLATVPKKGIAGLRFECNTVATDTTYYSPILTGGDNIESADEPVVDNLANRLLHRRSTDVAALTNSSESTVRIAADANNAMLAQNGVSLPTSLAQQQQQANLYRDTNLSANIEAPTTSAPMRTSSEMHSASSFYTNDSYERVQPQQQQTADPFQDTLNSLQALTLRNVSLAENEPANERTDSS